MLLKVKQLIIENNGYRRNVVSKNIYINSSSIVSIVDYEGAENFLLTEQSSFASDSFSLIKVNQGNTVRDVIAFGTADKIYSEISKATPGPRILND